MMRITWEEGKVVEYGNITAIDATNRTFEDMEDGATIAMVGVEDCIETWVLGPDVSAGVEELKKYYEEFSDLRLFKTRYFEVIERTFA